ncbi:Aste57867_14261 [Aphanomyces stellatus]|uniref:Aste57867_14261 protein n=1 Tax=Aphanomyces stellatus TaxID=120398 RepID=A0A485L072_9STRA|nr:hypothetical protein As57867_014210 [Aphanomyces stellatus]VFT91086.1 Aste57867_14261 [Aphanomyces stellatus]
MYGVFWVICGALYYSDYLHAFSGRTAHHLQLTFALVFGSYPLFVFLVWGINTELMTHIHGGASHPPNEAIDMTDHFSTSLRKDLMRYTTVGIIRSLREAVTMDDSPVRRLEKGRSHNLSDPNLNSRPSRAQSLSGISLRSDDFEDADTALWYVEKKRLATTVRLNTTKLKVYYEKLGFTDYAPRVFSNLRILAGIDPVAYETSFVGFIDILQHYGIRWKVQNLILSIVRDKRTITALPPPEYALRFLSFLHAHLLRSSVDGSASGKSLSTRASFGYGTI